jgi:hypothetical protein
MLCLKQHVSLDDGRATPSIAPSTTPHVGKQENAHGR